MGTYKCTQFIDLYPAVHCTEGGERRLAKFYLEIIFEPSSHYFIKPFLVTPVQLCQKLSVIRLGRTGTLQSLQTKKTSPEQKYETHENTDNFLPGQLVKISLYLPSNSNHETLTSLKALTNV